LHLIRRIVLKGISSYSKHTDINFLDIML